MTLSRREFQVRATECNLKPAVYKARGGNQRIPEGKAQRLEGGERATLEVAPALG